MTVSKQDIDQVRQLATQLKLRARDIETNVNQLTTGLTAVNWQGTDAQRFKSEWSNTYLPRLREAISALQAASQQASGDADTQERAST